jgi:hypothetical protein
MSVRALKWTIAILACAILLVGWRWFALFAQADAAARISSVCEETERIAVSESDPQALALQIQWLEVYYRLNNGRVSGSPLGRVARRGYEHTLTNAFSALRRLTTNDLSGDISTFHIHRISHVVPECERWP